MRKYIVIAALVLLGVVLSLLLVPGIDEIALMQFKDKRYEEAKRAYQLRQDEGTLTIDVASALTDLHLQYAEVDEAIAVMEQFVQQNPDNLEARKELGKLYQYAQRPDDYLRNLEEVNRIESNDESLKTMVEMYGATQQYEKQEPAMRVLATKDEQQKTPENFVYQSSLQASQGKNDEAIQTLTEFKKTFPKDFGFDQLQLLMTLQLDKDMDNEAYDAAWEWAKTHTDPEQVARLINILHYRGSPELGWRLMKPYEEQASGYPQLSVEMVYLLINLGREDEAYETLVMLEEQNALPKALYREYAFLALRAGDRDKALELVENLNPDDVTEEAAAALVEVALDKNDKQMLDILERKFAEQGGKVYPYFGPIMAVAQQRPNAGARLAELKKVQLPNTQLLQVARICAWKKRTECTGDFLDRINREGMTVSESIQLASLYIEARKIKAAREIADPLYAQSPENQRISDVRMKIAAAEGDTVFIEQWLKSQQSVSAKQYKELYFIAQDYKASGLAMQMAEGYHKLENNDESRSFLINSYLATNNYEGALPYLRELKSMSEQDKNDYLAVLMKLASKNPKYNAELAQFASSQLRGNLPERQKQALIYALINAGRADMALPYIREFAIAKGGEWVEIYAQNLDKVGRTDEARDFRMQIAMDPSVPRKTRRDVAFLLLDKNYKKDALKVFADLATTAKAEDPDVQQLLYLWGPRLSKGQLDWLASRAVNADSVSEQGVWIRYISNYADAETLVSFVDSHPEMLASPGLLETYLDAMYRLGRFEELEGRMAEYSAQTDNPTLLRTYAKTARAYNMNDVAKSAYGRLDELKGGDPEAQRNIGLMAFTKADYSETKENLQKYVDYRLENGRYNNEDYQAFFYLAQSYKRDKKIELANQNYHQVLDIVDAARVRTPDMEARAAQALVALGKKKEGYDRFEAAMQKYPNDALLRADFVSTLVESKDYARAQELAADPKIESHTSVIDMVSLDPVTLRADGLQGYRTFSNGNEILLEFTGEKAMALNEAALRKHSWLNFSSQGYDRALIAAKPQYRLKLEPTSGGYMIVPEKKETQDYAKFKEELALRYEMLQARIELETGKHYQAVERLNRVIPSYPDNGTLLGYTANAQNYVGRWKTAMRMLEDAEKSMPENEDIAALKRDIYLRHGQFVRLDYEWFRQGSSDQNILTLDGVAFIDDELEIGFVAQRSDIDGSSVRRIDGRVGDFEETKERGEIFVAHEDIEGRRIQGSLFANNDTMGAGAYYGWYHEYGMTRIAMEYHRPDWQFVEGVLDDATRDRIAVAHQYRINPLWTVAGEIGLNRYNMNGIDGVADSVSLQASVTRQLMEDDPFLAVNYTFDGEYRKDEKVLTDNNGDTYVPLLDSREVHSLSLVANKQFDKDTDLFVQGGYSYNRIGDGHGPLGAAVLTHQALDDKLELQLRANYGAFTSDNVGDSSRVGGYVKWRF